MSYHLRDIGDTGARLAIFAIVEQNHGVKEKSRPDGKSIEKQQDMEVLGVDLSPSVLIKDRTVVGAFDKIERMPLT